MCVEANFDPASTPHFRHHQFVPNAHTPVLFRPIPVIGIMWLSDRQKIGVALVAFGVFFMFLGVLLFFDRALLALGNVLFLAGLPLIIGPQRTFYFFARKEKWRGTICFFLGIVLVFCKWAAAGILIELIGFVGLFGSFFPVVLQALRQTPVIGTFLSLPYVRGVADRIAGVRQSAV